MTKLTLEQRERIRHLAKAGMRVQDLAERYRVSHQYIYQITSRKYDGYTRHISGQPIEELAHIREAMDALKGDSRVVRLNCDEAKAIQSRYAEGLARRKPYVTVKQIAEYVGIPVNTVKRFTDRRVTKPMAEAMAE